MIPRKRHKAEEIVAKLRQVEVLTSQGQPVAEAVRSIGVTEVTYYRWRSEYGGLKGDQVKRLKELEAENTRLRRAVSDLTLDKMILAEAARGKLLSPSRRRACVEHAISELGVPERRACRVLGQHRSTQSQLVARDRMLILARRKSGELKASRRYRRRPPLAVSAWPCEGDVAIPNHPHRSTRPSLSPEDRLPTLGNALRFSRQLGCAQMCPKMRSQYERRDMR